MNKIFKVLMLVLLYQTSFGQFQVCNSSVSQDLYDVCFVNQDTGIALGDSGTIVRSIDGGLNWTLVMENDTVKFTKVKFFDHLNGMAIGTAMYRTNNAGLTWLAVPHSNTTFYDIEIINATTCLISGEPTALIQSTDLGASFISLVSSQNQNIGLLSFINENVGYACTIADGGPNPTLKTLDGGISWDTLPHLNHNTVMEAMEFVSESVGFKGGWYSASLQKTTDGASSWSTTSFTNPQAQGELYDFHIEPNLPHAYYACGWNGEIFKSTDGGDQWLSLNSGLSNNTSLFGIYFISETVGWAVGAQGTIIKTTNGGQPVGLPQFGKEPYLVLYPNPTTGWLSVEVPNQVKIQRIEIYNLSGQKMNIKSHLNKMDLTTLSTGSYILKITTGQGEYSEKIIKE